MKSAWKLCAILFLGTAVLAQTTTAPKANDAKPALATAIADGAQTSGRAIVLARLEGDGSGSTASAKPNTSAGASSEKASEASKPADNNAAPATPSAPAKPDAPTMEDQVQQLRDLVVTQSKELQATREQMKQQQEKMETLEQQLRSSSGAGKNASSSKDGGSLSAIPSTAASPVSAQPAAVAAPEVRATSSSSARTGSGGAAPAATPAQKVDETSPESPLQLKVGSAYITPVGFMDFTGVWRSRNGGSGIGTNFAGVPYGGSTSYQANQSEFRMSMQNSRIGFRVDADVKGSHVIGYMEADFLGNNPPNVALTSNSNTLRSRLYWVDVRKSSFELLGGQTWSLATPNRVGVSPLPGDVFFSYNMDVNYQLGMVWGRIPEFRMVYHLPHDKAAFAFALDSPDQYVGGSNGSAAITPPACCSTYLGGQADNGTTTLGPPNRGPDIIAKFVADPSKRLHFEVGGIARFFQLYNPETTTHYSATGGAGFVNLDAGLTKEFRLLTHNYWSDGGGRYIFGSAPDFVARGNGSPSLVHSGATVDGFEYSHKNTTLFGYYGLLYIARNVVTDTNGCNIGWGYGPSASSLTGCTSPSSGQNRSVQEGTVGFIQNFWKNPKYGALSLIGQYSYLTRDPWYVAPAQPKNAHMGMAFLDLRYTLPGSAPTLGKPGKE